MGKKSISFEERIVHDHFIALSSDLGFHISKNRRKQARKSVNTEVNRKCAHTLTTISYPESTGSLVSGASPGETLGQSNIH